MGTDVMDDLEGRLRASRPSSARVDERAFDADLLDRVRTQPVHPRRGVQRKIALPVAAAATFTVAAVVMLAGGPADVGGPPTASAITQALHWLDPPAGTVLHVRSVETFGGRTRVRESWQSADHPLQERVRVEGEAYETAGDAFYETATNTIYVRPDGAPRSDKEPAAAAISGDPAVQKVRFLLKEGRMTVSGRQEHNGRQAWAISLKQDVGRPVWTLWVSADDGKPLELRDPGRDANEGLQVIRWPVYEVLSGANAGDNLSLKDAHPSATVVRDPAKVSAAEQRLLPEKP